MEQPGILSFSFLVILLLYLWGGFFDKWGVPQLIVVTVMGVSYLWHMITYDPNKMKRHNILVSLSASAVNVVLLLWGGFFGAAGTEWIVNSFKSV